MLAAGLAALAIALAAAQSPGQPPGPPDQQGNQAPGVNGPAPLPDPEAFFGQFFGGAQDDDKVLAAIEVSPAEEERLGNAAADAFLAELKRLGIRVVNRGRDAAYLRAMVETVRPQMQNARRYRNIRVWLAESSYVEARSFPGGTLVFFRGLLEAADDEAALVGVVGHELSHLDRGHCLTNLRRMKLAQQTFSNSGQPFSPQRWMAAGSTLVRMWCRPFRPEDESAADRDGATWAYRLGYDPRRTAALFLKLSTRDQPLPAFFPDWLRSHPRWADRHQAILALYDELQKQQPRDRLYVGRENLRRRVPRSQKQFAE